MKSVKSVSIRGSDLPACKTKASEPLICKDYTNFTDSFSIREIRVICINPWFRPPGL
ncbi:Uncharacterized protein dnm_005000 [Desulfonema magnum]|uniref:Uncharacterized protein n=1 Tax=Desulfonema magnum TaxID=45655 RepID=A0A975BFT1_9BACT|nr:Uncharacterized protein dnm_005000 [Desulfonema magnum]